MSQSYVDVKNQCVILVTGGYVYSVAYTDWVIDVRNLIDGVRASMPGVEVLGLDVELPRILSSRGILHKVRF